MSLTSFSFLLFFPIVFLLHYLVFSKNKDVQNVFIILSSCVFYGWWDWRFLGLVLLTAVSTYYSGVLMGRNQETKVRKRINITAIVLNLGILFCFKYFNFFVQSFVDLFHAVGINLSISTLRIVLPIGISFYTFSALSYTIDVYQKKIEPTKDILAYIAYIVFFPSILSGPINRADKQLPQFIKLRKFDYDKVMEGTKLLIWGLFVKLCVADRLGIYVDSVYSNLSQHTGMTMFFASVVYTIQIYADFSGYSLMAIGLGKMLGVDLQTNFVRPYFSTTVTEFWRRWHISLTTWFRDYLYFPLGGNRCSRQRWIFNTMLVFIISGLWHGAAYTFLIWGTIHGLCMVIEKVIYGDKIKSVGNTNVIIKSLKCLITFMIVNFAWIFFRANTLQDALYIDKQIFTMGGGETLFIDKTTLALGFVSFFILLIKDLSDEYKWKFKLLNSKNGVVSFASVVFLICYILLFGVLNGGSFIYFQF